MSSKPNAIVLGGTSPHIVLIENLKRRGYHTVLVDYYENPPAKAAADEHIQASTLDKDKVLQISKDINAKLVITTCVDQANVTACYVAEKLELPAPYSYQTALNVTDKELMKSIMIDNGISTSRYTSVKDTEFRDAEIRYPVVVKPADSNGSKGVRKANNVNEVGEYLREALSISRSGSAIIEEYKEGLEIQIDCFIQNGSVHIVMVRDKLTIEPQEHSILQSFGSFIPSDVSETVRTLILQTASSIAQSFELNNTPLMIQAIVNGNDVNVIEFAPRVGGGLSYKLIKEITGFDIIDATIDSFLGNRIALKYHAPDSYYLTGIIYAHKGILGSIQGVDELLDDMIIEEFFQFKMKGETIGSDMSSNNRVGAFIVKAHDKEELLRKTKLAMDMLEVYDTEGHAIMRKNIHLKRVDLI